MESQGPLRGAQPLVDLQKLLADVFDNILADFLQLSQPDAAGQLDRDSADQRKHRLLQHLHGTRQQLLRALVLLNWKPWKVLTELVDHDRVLDLAASHVRTMHEVVQQMRQQAAGRIMAGSYLNMYDVNTALEVLTTGTYQELPSIILHRPPLFQPPPASLARQRSRLAHVTQLIRSRLVQVPLPPGLKVVSIGSGTAVLRAEGLYEAKLTLVPSEPLPGLDSDDAAAAAASGAGAGPGPSRPTSAGTAAEAFGGIAAAAATADPAAATAAAQRWKWRLIHFVLLIGVPFYDPRQPGQILNTCNFHMVLAADNAAYLRRQRQLRGGCAAAAAAPSTVSESAATPAASGLPGAAAAAAAAAAGGGSGGSLAAAVRRMEDDEVGAPLAVMHAILTDVSGRLLVDELAAAARALAAPGSRWHGHIAVKPSQQLHPGVRIEYWITAPPLLSLRALPSPPPGEDYPHVKPGPPFLELGMGEGGCLEVLHAPSSLHHPLAGSKLRLDTFRINLEEVLMRAANMSSQYQLMLIRMELKSTLPDAWGKRAYTCLRLTSLARQMWCREGNAPREGEQPQGAVFGAGEDDMAGNIASDATAATAGAAAGPSSSEAAAAVASASAHAGTTTTATASTAPAAPASAAPMDVDAPADGTGSSAGAAGTGTGPLPPIPPPAAPPPEVSGLLARAALPEEAAGAVVVLNTPVLEYLVSGTTELKIGKHLFSGRLTLRPGQDERDEGSLDYAATTAMNEDFVNQAALSAYATASADDYPAARAIKDACAALSHVLQRTHTSTDATHFIQAARRAALHISRLPRGMLEAFTAACPGLAIEPRPREKAATWALQCVPFPANFPPLEPVAPDTPHFRVPQCLSFFLQSRLSLASPHVLVVCSCTKQLMPIKVLSCIPVPPSTYRLPEHVIAAYMAVSSAAHHHSNGGGGGGGGAGGHAVGQHSLPHSGANSPRGGGPGMDVLGHSPETSPLRESSAGQGHGLPPGPVAGTAATTAAAPGRYSTAGGGAGGSSVAVGGSCGGLDQLALGGPGGLLSVPSSCSLPHSAVRGGMSSGPNNASGSGSAARVSGHGQGQGHPLAGAHQRGSVGVSLGGSLNSLGGGASLGGAAVGGSAGTAIGPGSAGAGAGAGSGAGASHSGRPTGQQVAVMLAQQQLSSVVRWCRRRMVWEVLLVQLQAVGAAFQELSSPPCQRLRITRVAGTALPCLIARRRGLAPPRVGPTCLELELGPDALAGQVTARLYGRFLCAPACAPAAAASAASAAGGSSGGGFVQEPYASPSAGAAGGGGGIVCLRRTYCLERGQSALTLVQDVCAVIRTQTLLARLEMTAIPGVGSMAAAAGPGPGPVAGSGQVGSARRRLLQPQRLAVLAPLAGAPATAAAPSASHLLNQHAHSHPRQRPHAHGHGHGHGPPHSQQQHPHHPQPPQQQWRSEVGPDGQALPGYSPGHGLQGFGSGPAGYVGADGVSHHAAKRIKLEPVDHGGEVLANGSWDGGGGHHGGAAGLANGGTGGGGGVGNAYGGHRAGGGGLNAPPPVLTWHWPLVGTLTLEEYSVSAATVRVTPCTTQAWGSPALPDGGAAAAGGAVPAPPLQLHMTWAPRDVRHLHGSAAAAPPPPTPGSPGAPTPAASPLWPGSPTPVPTAAATGNAPSPYAAPTPGPSGVGPAAAVAVTPISSGMLPPDAVVTTTRAVVGRSSEPFGNLFSDLVLCTFSCSSGHTLPPEYLHVLEEFAEAGEEGKLLDAVAVAAWPLAGFCSSLRPTVLSRYGMSADSDVRMTLHQPPYCHRIVCRRRGAPNHLLIDLICQAVGRSYLKITVPSLLPGQQQLPQQLDPANGGAQGPAGAGAGKQEDGAPSPAQSVLPALQQLVPSRLGAKVHVSVGGRAAMYGGLGPRPPMVPGPGSPLWLLVPNDLVQQAVELVLSVL